MKTRKKRGKTGKKWARYGLKRVNKEGTGGINWGECGCAQRRLAVSLTPHAPSTGGALVGYGGSAGEGGSASECPFVHFDAASGYYYLFRTQRYSPDGGQTSVYASRDPSNFGVGEQSDAYLVARLPFCAPELVELSDGRVLVVALAPGLNGFRVAELAFGKQDAAVTVKSDDADAEDGGHPPRRVMAWMSADCFHADTATACAGTAADNTTDIMRQAAEAERRVANKQLTDISPTSYRFAGNGSVVHDRCGSVCEGLQPRFKRAGLRVLPLVAAFNIGAIMGSALTHPDAAARNLVSLTLKHGYGASPDTSPNLRDAFADPIRRCSQTGSISTSSRLTAVRACPRATARWRPPRCFAS